MSTVLWRGRPLGLETHSAQDPTTSASALGRGRRIAVVGGSGFYGRYLVADLLRFTGAQVLVVSRRAPQRLRPSDRVVPIACDLRDPRALREAIGGSAVVVHCAGPFQHLPLEPVRAAIATGVDYVDISEDRAYRRRVLAMDAEARAAGIVVLNGASVVPGMQALFTELLRPRFDELLAVCGSAAPDTRRHRGHAMFHTMLLGAGRPFQAPRDGLPVRVHGWREPEWFDFPAPVGRRLHYLVLEMADLDVLPELFGVGTVTFKAGSEFPLLNRLLGGAAALRARTGHPRLEAYTWLVRGLSWLVGRFGNEAGGVIFEVTGRRGGMPQRQAIAVVGEADGGRIPAVLAGMAVQELLAGQLATPGVADLRSWLPQDRLIQGLVRRGLRLWWRQDAEIWQDFRTPTRGIDMCTPPAWPRHPNLLPRRRLHRGAFLAAGLYNLGWGLYTVVDPQWLFRFARMPPQNYPEVFACLGMVIGLYGVLYLEVARLPEQNWPAAAVGMAGKVLGPLGFAHLLLSGQWPLRAGIIVLTNDLLWWLPFALYLHDAWTTRRPCA